MTNENWHLDKRVPVALIVTIAVQTTFAIWWAATLTSQVNTNTQAISLITRNAEADRGALHEMALNTRSLTEEVKGLRADAARSDRTLQEILSVLRPFRFEQQ